MEKYGNKKEFNYNYRITILTNYLFDFYCFLFMHLPSSSLLS